MRGSGRPSHEYVGGRSEEYEGASAEKAEEVSMSRTVSRERWTSNW